MLVAVILSALLMIDGIGRDAASDLQVYGMLSDNILNCRDGRCNLRKQPHQQIKHNIRRILDLESFALQVMPTSSKGSLPTIIKLFPPTVQAPNRLVNMPMRFGRDSIHDDDHNPNSHHSIPQRFGKRSGKVIRPCAGCCGDQRVPKQPIRHEMNSQHWSLLRILANTQSLNTGLHWAEELGFFD